MPFTKNSKSIQYFSSNYIILYSLALRCMNDQASGFSMVYNIPSQCHSDNKCGKQMTVTRYNEKN